MQLILKIFNFNRKKCLVFLTLFCAIFFLQYADLPLLPEKKMERYYFMQLRSFQKQLIAFDKGLQEKAGLKILRQSFYRLRLCYKKFAILTEYFNAYDNRQLNGPAIPYSEDDNTATIMPHGLEVVEEKLFAADPIDYGVLKNEMDSMLVITRRWLNEPQVEKKFTRQLVSNALQLSLIRLMTMGITGFDSPMAKYSLPEAASTLESIQVILSIYQPGQNEAATAAYQALNILLQRSISYITEHNHFNTFDRLDFIKQYLCPVYDKFVTMCETAGFEKSQARSPFRNRAHSIFDSTFFNIDFFSPNQRFRSTTERIALGNRLFYDPILSGSKKRSCASCHKPELAFTDGLTTALAMDEKKHLLRNTPTLWNSALQTKQFYDSRTETLENQLSDVVHNAEEMKGALKGSVVAFNNDPAYSQLFAKAYPGVTEHISEYNIANAVSCYVRSLIALNSKFDRYMRSEINALSSSEKKGFNLFTGKARCATCHYLPLFNGLAPPDFTESESEVLGVPATKDALRPVLDKDEGKSNYTKAPVHRYAFKTPTLRNVALTAPYMHNGVFSTLEEVMDFYNRGGGSGLKIAPVNQTLPRSRLNLSKTEMADIIAFLKTLTDTKSKLVR